MAVTEGNAGIYKIVCFANGHFYIGRTVNFAKRRTAHLRDLERGQHKNPRLQATYDKYGIDYFQFFLLEVAPKHEHAKLEQKYLDTVVESGGLHEHK